MDKFTVHSRKKLICEGEMTRVTTIISNIQRKLHNIDGVININSMCLNGKVIRCMVRVIGNGSINNTYVIHRGLFEKSKNLKGSLFV